MSALDEARANLEAWLETGDARTALEQFEAAVRANERAATTRAAVLREAIAEIERNPMGCVVRLRRMADEAVQP